MNTLQTYACVFLYSAHVRICQYCVINCYLLSFGTVQIVLHLPYLRCSDVIVPNQLFTSVLLVKAFLANGVQSVPCRAGPFEFFTSLVVFYSLTSSL